MGYNADEVPELEKAFGELSAASEGGVTFIRIARLVLPEGCQPREVTALLCPTERDGYPSRLFISEKVAHPGKAGWNPGGGSVILGQQWWALSWKIRPDQRLLQQLLDHLGAFRP